MRPDEYIKLAVRTSSGTIHGFQPLGLPPYPESETLHGAIGIATESGELLDAIKKSLFYGRDFDRVNLREELGDLMWYIALICHSEKFSLEEIMSENIEKLRKRYPERFTKELSEERRDKQ